MISNQKHDTDSTDATDWTDKTGADRVHKLQQLGWRSTHTLFVTLQLKLRDLRVISAVHDLSVSPVASVESVLCSVKF